ncbi:MAG: transcriptional regulator NrdR [Candidatus Symbiobacter sp.]|nr:transcriptional regulator NrdR [Candidatus Symbiobacter sp.]
MRCPFCGAANSSVKDSRPSDDDSVIRRRRACESCGSRFTTFERVQLREITVIKRDGRQVAFDREKLIRSVKIATRKRGVGADQIDHMVDRLLHRLDASGENEIASAVIGEMVMEELAKLDLVSYIRFASVYRDFRDVRDFGRLIAALTPATVTFPPSPPPQEDRRDAE